MQNLCDTKTFLNSSSVVETYELKKDKNAFHTIKKGSSETLAALDYLFSTNYYYHLDLKGDNAWISIGDSTSTILCDFSGLNVTEKYLRR